MAVRAGDLRERLEVWKADLVTEDQETDSVYQPLRTIWAHVTPSSGRTATLPGETERAEITHKVTIRAPSLPEICREMYFVVRGQRLDVLYWYPSQIGYKESPGNINKYGAWAGNNGAAWCVYFVCWCADQSGSPIPTGYGGVSEMRSYFQSRGRYKTVASGYIPQAGDLMIQGDRHIGIVIGATRAAVQTIEGNCSDSVCAMTRYYSEITGFCTPWG